MSVSINQWTGGYTATFTVSAGPSPVSGWAVSTILPAGSAIVNAVGPIRQIVRGAATVPRRYLVIVSGTPGHLGAMVQVQVP